MTEKSKLLLYHDNIFLQIGRYIYVLYIVLYSYAHLATSHHLPVITIEVNLFFEIRYQNV